MCGIIGYVGDREASEVLVKGLESLEYRGYDSSGIAVHTGEEILVEKRAGRLARLTDALRERPLRGRIGIGHTRWATHGAATDLNAHPFLSRSGAFAVVHNGILTNYTALARELRARGIALLSDTDSEVIAHLLELFFDGDALAAVSRTVRVLEGSFALAILAKEDKEALYGVRKDSPLIVGAGEEESVLCSDISGIPDFCDRYVALGEGRIVRVTRAGVTAYDLEGGEVPLVWCEREEGAAPCDKTGDSYMISEIRETERALRATYDAFPHEEVRRILRGGFERFAVLGCGSAYHAGLVFEAAMREWLGVAVETHVASEFLTRRPICDEKTLFVVVSQSGETADTLQAVKRAKAHGAKVLSVCNVKDSSLVRLADACVITKCGTERAVAATKSYSAQVLSLLLICIEYAEISERLEKTKIESLQAEVAALADKARVVVGREGEAQRIADALSSATSVYYMGRGADYFAAKEGSLKLKEVSYIFSEAYPSGELKHGTLALMEEGVYACFVATDPRLAEKNAASLSEVRCRGASTVAILSESIREKIPADLVLTVPDGDPVCSPVLTAIYMQLIAYYAARRRGRDADRPRNLAKSVTVE